MYQWYETEDPHSENNEAAEHDSHAARSYSYSTDWFENHVDSSSFYNSLGTYIQAQSPFCKNAFFTTTKLVLSAKKGGKILAHTQLENVIRFIKLVLEKSVSDPNPYWIRIQSGQWICIRIQEGKNGPQR